MKSRYILLKRPTCLSYRQSLGSNESNVQVCVVSSECCVRRFELTATYLWLVENGGMGYNYNYYYYHSSIPY